MSIFKVTRTVRSFYTGGKVHVRNGTILYACIGDSLVQTDLESGESLYFPVNEGDPISLFTVSKDGKIALISTKSTLFFVFDLQQQRSIKSWRGYHGVPVELAIDPSNSICAACYSDRSMRIWELESGICLNSLKGFNNFCTFLDFDPTEVAGIFRLFCGGSEGQLNVYQTSLEGQCKLLFKKENAHASAITAIKISPASDYFVTFSRDKIVTQWSMRDFSQQKSLLIGESVEDGELVFEEPTNQQSANSVMFALGGENGSVSLWNFTNGSCLWKEEGVKVKNRQMITKLILISSSRLISFSSDHSIRTFSVLPNQLVFAKSLNGHKEEITDLCVLEDLLVASTNNESVKVFNRNDLFYCQELKGHSDIVLCLAVKRFQNTRFLLSGSKDNSACLWCKPDGKGEFRLLTEAVGHTAAIGAVAFSFDSNEISFLTASQDKTIKLWHLQPKSTSENTELNLPDSMQFELRSSYTVKAHDKDINAISVSPNNKLVLTCSQDKSAKLWNFHDGSFVAGLKGHKRGVSCAIFHPQEQVIATCSADKSIKLWSATDFSCIQTLEGHLFSILKISFIKQGAELVSVSSDGLVKIWSVKNGECLGTFDEHLDKIWAISFTPDFSQMYTGGADSCIKEWMDVTEQEERRLLDERNASIDASQRLGNMLKRKDYKNAFFLAFQLGQPYKLFGILKSLLTADGFDVKLLQEIISTVPREQLGLLLDYCKEWNTSFSKALVAQFVLAAIFTKWKPQELIKEPGMDKRIEALLPYTAKHHFLRTRGGGCLSKILPVPPALGDWMGGVAVVFVAFLSYLLVAVVSSQLPDVNFSLPIAKCISHGVFDNWQAGEDFCLPKYKLVYTLPRRQSQVEELKRSNHTVESFVDYKEQQFICLVPQEGDFFASQVAQSDDADPVSVGLGLLAPMEGTCLSLKQTHGTEFITWEFWYKERALKKKFHLLSETGNHQTVIGRFGSETQPVYNSFSGSLVFDLQERDSKSGRMRKTKVSLSCGPVEGISAVNEILETFYEMSIETPLLCSNDLFSKLSSQRKPIEIQCSIVIPDDQYEEALKEYSLNRSAFAHEMQPSTPPVEQDLTPLSDLLNAFDDGVQEEIEKTKKLLNIALNPNDPPNSNGIKELLENAANDYTKVVEIIEKLVQKQQEKRRKRKGKSKST